MVAGSTPSPIPTQRPVTLASTKAIDGSGSASNTSGVLFGGVTPPNGYEVQNLDGTISLAISEGVVAVFQGVGSNTLIPGQLYTSPINRRPAGPISIIAASGNPKFTARYW